MKVLITSIGSNTSIGVAKGLRLAFGDSIQIFGTDIYAKDESAGFAFVNSFHQISSVRDQNRYNHEMLKLVRDEKIECVIPIHDLEIDCVSGLSETLPDDTFWAVNRSAVIEICNNKLLSNQTAEKYGLVVPEYVSGDDQKVLPDGPVIGKPMKGVSSRGIITMPSALELKQQIKNDPSYLIQRFISGGKEYTVDCYSNYQGKFIGGVARRRIETKDGMSTKGEVENLPGLIALCANFLNGLRYKGASNLQFIFKDGIYYFIEINPRFSGGGILSFKAGFNSAAFTILEAQKQPINFFPEKVLYGLKMTRYWDEIFYNEKGDRI